MYDYQFHEVLEELDKIKGFSYQQYSPDDYACAELRSTLAIDSNGYVYPCNKLFYRIGSIYKNTIKDILNNSVELDYIREIRWRDLNECSGCKNKKHCFRCPGVALLEDGNILGKSSLACNIAQTRCNIYNR